MPIRALLALSLTLAAGAAAAEGATPTSSSPEQWQRECASRADALKLGGGERDTYLRECVGGERLDSQPSPEKSAKPSR
ncbi:hypothetical protein M446_3766 [Methylobacterium sp. 4-46]|uniref:hypothetical protein n=1 Tax=unclassified Methylobacterium TaxID=2615210 RepID=UPI000165C917|nr:MULTISPECIES: hypothetical protein [Methylobacterium]ACA18145.1 hypothetical protein M446_3766 [Methylobacterium sp. 4-46]WFT77443.1 hypothetical protein QA634_19095 [Methylobacterium nodulans]